jgi:PAS domain S-box-containing protein
MADPARAQAGVRRARIDRKTEHMIEPDYPPEEAERLAALRQLCVLDTAPEERFDRVTRTASALFGVDIALVTLVDQQRQWFKSSHGLEPRAISFCGHAILNDAVLVIEDAARDPRFSDNPLVTGAPHIRFYAGVPLHGPEGRLVGTLCIIDRQPRQLGAAHVAALVDLGAMVDAELDSSTLKQAVEAADNSASRLRAIIDHVIDGIITIDQLGTIETMNRAALRLFGYRLEEVVGRDVSERHHVEHIQARFSAIIASSSDAIMSETLDGLIASCNRAAVAMFGYSESELIGQPMSMLMPSDLEEEESGIVALIRDGQAVEPFETLRRKKNGELFYVSITASPIRNAAGVITGASNIARDITGSKRKQALLVAAKQDAEQAKSAFLANMSHEIRTPMNAVLGMVHLMAGTALSDEQRRYLDMILISGKNLLDILNDVLDFSKIEAGKMELAATPFRLNDVLHAVATIMSVNAGEKDLELVIGVEPDVPPLLLGDALRLQQGLVNLTGNAIKFTEQGEVTLRIECLSRDRAGATLRCSVRDTGVGMSAQQQAGLFSPFSQVDSSITRRFGGSGLGMTISRRLVDRMGGTIEVRSAPGQGNEFALTLTLALGAGGRPASAPGALCPLRVLLVDDHPGSRHHLGQLIESWHWSVEPVASGAQAIARVRELAANGERFDVLLIGSKMADMDGVATMQAIDALTPRSSSPAIIMVNAFGRGQLMRDPGSTMADAFLTKPVTAASLLETIEQALAGRRTGAAARDQPYLLADAKRIDAHVLLVEDNRLNQIVARGILEQAGATVEVAENGQQAIDLLRRDPKRYDLVLMDVQMPVMDGFTATRLIRQQLGLGLPVLAMTAGVLESERAQCTESGMDDFVGKPIDVEQMFGAIGRHLPVPPNGSTRAAQCAPAAVAPGAGDGVFDVSQLIAIAGDNADYLAATMRVIRNMAEGGAAQIELARRALSEGRHADAARVFHSMRGSIGTLGASRFMRAASDIEMALRARDDASAEPLFARAAQEMAMVAAAAQAWLATQAALAGTPP